MKILLVWRAQYLGETGGMERVCANLSNHFAESGNDTAILFCAEKEGRSYFPLRENVKLINMLEGIGNTKRMYLPWWGSIVREALRIYDKRKMYQWVSLRKNKFLSRPVKQKIQEYNPDVIISVDPETTILLRESLGYNILIPIVTMFHFPVEKSLRWQSKKEKKAIESSSVVQLLTADAARKFSQEFPNVKTIKIPNAVLPCTQAAELQGKTKHQIVYVARFDRHVKRQHLLVDAFAKLANQFPNWHLVMYGYRDNEYSRYIKKMVKDRGLNYRIRLEPPTNNVYEVYKKSDIVAFPSAYEGFGLSLAEAMNAGLPSIGFASASGVNELIKDCVTGFLANDGVDSFANKLRLLMEDEALRVQMGKAAREDMRQFEPERIWKQWDRLVSGLIH